MAKKGGKGEKRSQEKGPKLPKVVDGLHLSEMSKGQLCGHIKRLMTESETEKREMNLFLLEKQKLYSMWNISMDRMKELQADANTLVVQTEESRKNREEENGIQTQKLRQLQNQDIKNFGLTRLNHLQCMRLISNEIWELETLLRESSTIKRKEIRSQMRAQYEMLRLLHMKHDSEIQNMLHTMSDAIDNQGRLWERSFENKREESTAALTSIDKIVFLNKLKTLQNADASHDKTLLDLKTFFNDMTVNNFAVITSLSGEVEDLKCANSRLVRILQHAKKNYHNVVGPIEKMQKELKDIEHDGAEKLIRHTFFEMKKLHKVLEGKRECLDQLEILIEVLQQQVTAVKKERNVLKQERTKDLLNIQKRASMHSFLMELKRKAAIRDLRLLQGANPNQSANFGPNLQQLHQLPLIQEQRIKQDIQQYEKVKKEFQYEAASKKPSVINREMKEEGRGLIHKKRIILPSIYNQSMSIRDRESSLQNTEWNENNQHNNNYNLHQHNQYEQQNSCGVCGDDDHTTDSCTKRFKGMAASSHGAAAFKSRVKYQGHLPPRKMKELTLSGVKNVGYGFYYYDPNTTATGKLGGVDDIPDDEESNVGKSCSCSQEELRHLPYISPTDSKLRVSMSGIPRYSELSFRTPSTATAKSHGASKMHSTVDFRLNPNQSSVGIRHHVSVADLNKRSLYRLKSILGKSARPSMVAFNVTGH